MTEKFSWETVYQRRAVFAKQIKQQIGVTGFGFEVEEEFGVIPLTDQSLANKPMWKVPFYVIAQRMIEAAGLSVHVIDHAWWLITDDGYHEPWGFVTEPYMDPEKAAAVAAEVGRQHKRWGVTVKVWPSTQSPWYPNSTVPIVTCIVGDDTGVGLTPFLKFGVGAALDHLWKQRQFVDSLPYMQEADAF